MLKNAQIVGSALDEQSRWNIIRRRVIEHNAVRACELLTPHVGEVVVIKGVAAARHYPTDILRDSIDVDIAVDPRRYAYAKEIVNENAGLGLAIDLHRGLRAFSDADWDEVLRNTELLAVDDGNIRVLRPELHLRVLCHHWLIDGARDRVRLRDLKFLIDDTKGAFDWELFYHDLSSIRSDNYCIAIALADREFGIDLSGTPLDNSAFEPPSWLIEFVDTEWKREFKHMPMESSIVVKGKTFEQLSDRIHPNPVRAIIESGGSLRSNRRWFYKTYNFFYRIPSTISRIGWVIYHEWRLRRKKQH